MGSLRKPLFIAALVLFLLAVLVELGSGLALESEVDGATLMASLPEDVPEDEMPSEAELVAMNREADPPGFGVPFLALLDGLLLFTVLLIAVALVLPERVHGRIQGVTTLIVALLAAIAGLVMIFGTLLALTLMVALFTSAPFGTIAYIAAFGFFDRDGARIALSLLMTLKVAAGICLVLAHQRFLQNKGLVALYLTSLLGTIVVSFLHNLVPRVLVSITDAVAGIIVAILAVIWAVLLLIGAVVSVVKSIRLDRSAA